MKFFNKLTKVRRNVLGCLVAYVIVTSLFLAGLVFESEAEAAQLPQAQQQRQDKINVELLVKCHVYAYRSGNLEMMPVYEMMISIYANAYYADVLLAKGNAEGFLMGRVFGAKMTGGKVYTPLMLKKALKDMAARLYRSYRPLCLGILKTEHPDNVLTKKPETKARIQKI